MLSVEEAVKIFHEEYKGDYVGYICDVGHSFIITPVDEEGEALDMDAIAINKTTGKTEAYFEPDHWEELENAIEIDYTEIKH